MSDLISREAVIKDLITNFAYHYPLFDGSRLGAKDYLVRREDVVAFLLKCPTIDAEPVRRGCWFPYSVVGEPLLRFQCSVCHHWVDGGTDRNFCPNCGAKMD